jgi:hypothetical protein
LSVLDVLKLVGGFCPTLSGSSQGNETWDHSGKGNSEGLPVLLVDEAEDLPIDTLREIQLLANPHGTKQTLFQVVLAGRTKLDQILTLDEFRELRGLISSRSHIKPLGEEETEQYIAGRLRIAHNASLSMPLFREGALKAVCCHSRGIPRLINRICESALIRGHALRQMNITAALVEEVARQPYPDISHEERIPRKNSGDTNELLKAAGILFETRVNLQRSRSEAPSLFRPPPAMPFAS